MLAWAEPLSAQQQQVQRDPAAVTTLQSAVAALGGEANVSAIQDCRADAKVQSLSPFWPDGTEAWKVSGKNLRREATYGGSRNEIVVIGPRGAAAISRDGKSKRLNVHSSAGEFVPFLVASELLRRLRDSRYALVAASAELAGGRSAIRIRSWLDTDEIDRSVTYQEWLIDAATGVPLRLDYRLAENANALATIPVSIAFADYRQVSGVAFPFSLTFTLDGNPWKRVLLDSVVLNSGISPSEFDVPVGGVQ